MSRNCPDDGASAAIAVALLDRTAGCDIDLIEGLTALINGVYAAAESGLWRPQAVRTSASELTELIKAEQIAVATVGGQLAGAIHVQALSDITGEFGMLAATPEHRGIGVGRALIDFAEQHCADDGLQVMQLELLVPSSWRHPSKVFLDDWYRRLGYRVIRTASVEDLHPALAPLIATPCQFVIYQKALDGKVTSERQERGGSRSSGLRACESAGEKDVPKSA